MSQKMLARNLKSGMLVKAQPGYAIVVRKFDYRPPGVGEDETGFTVMNLKASYFVRLTSAARVLNSDSPVMYYATVRTKVRKKYFTKHTFLVGSEVVYLHGNSCRGLEPVII